MTPDPLPPVPSPPEHHWRQFRVNVLPVLSFVAVLVVTVWLWGKNLANPVVMGQAESIVVDVSSPTAGRIAKLNVALFEEVKEGDVIAVVDAIEPLVLSNTVAKIRAEMDLIRAEAGMDDGDKTRHANFRLNWMIWRADLAGARAQLNYAQGEYNRISKLAAEKIASEGGPEGLDFARSQLDQLTLEVEQKTLAVEAAEKTWRELYPGNATGESTATKAALAVAEQELHLAEAELQPIVLTAPISGRVSKVDKMAGATVGEDVPIVTIANPTCDRIIGYLSQPLRIEPKINMKVEVRSRGLIRKVGEAKVVGIGPRMDLFDAPLRVRGMSAAQERGLPIIISIPPNMSIRPGEFVDIRLLVN